MATSLPASDKHVHIAISSKRTLKYLNIAEYFVLDFVLEHVVEQYYNQPYYGSTQSKAKTVVNK